MSGTISKRINALSEASNRYPHSYHPSRRKKGHKLSKNITGENGKIASESDSFCHVTGALPGKINGQFLISPNLKLDILSHLVPLLYNHPDYIDKDWSGSESTDEVFNYVIRQFQELNDQKYITYFHVNDLGKRELYRILTCKESYEYGNLISCDWLRNLSRSNRSAYNVAMSFFSFCFKVLHIPIWNEYDEECHIDYLEQELSYYDESNEELPKEYITLPKSIRYYQNYALRHYGHKILNHEISKKEFAKILKAYHPRKKKYKALKAWMEGAITLADLGYNFSESYIPHLTDLNCTNGEYGPYRYCRFIWSDNDALGSSMVQSICENAANLGLIPLVDYELITADNIANKNTLGLSSEFYEWMSNGHSVTSQLY